MRIFAFSYPLLLLAIWTAVVLAGDFVVLETSGRQIRSGKFSAAVGEIIRCEMAHGTMGPRGINIGYAYRVNGIDYTGHRYRYDDLNAFDYKSVTNAYPPGSRHWVYFNPSNPGDSVLSPRLHGSELLLALFAIPLNVVTFAIWISTFRSRFNGGRVAPAGGLRIIRDEGGTRVRLAEFSPWAAGFFGLAAAGFAAALPVVFVCGFTPSLRLMSIVLLLVAAAGVAAFLWTAVRHHFGYCDLRIQSAPQTLLCVPARGCKQPLQVPGGEIVAVSMRRRVSHSPSGKHFSYVPALDRAAPDSLPQSIDLADWGWPEPKARALAGWLSQQLDVPFIGVKEDK